MRKRARQEPSEQQIKEFMQREMYENEAEYFDSGGEFNATKLAEQSALYFDVDHWLDDPSHPIWDWSLEVGEEFGEPMDPDEDDLSGYGRELDKYDRMHMNRLAPSHYGTTRLARLRAQRIRVSSFESDESIASELTLHVNNTSHLYDQRNNIEKSLIRKMSADRYNSDLANKAFMYVVDEGAKDYVREFGSPGDRWFEMFPKGVRELAAQDLKEMFEAEVGANPDNFEEFVPKKHKRRWKDRGARTDLSYRRARRYR